MDQLHMEDVRMYEASIRQTKLGDVYLDLADRFDLSQEGREQLDRLLAEPDGHVVYLAEWERRARELFPVWKENRILFYNALRGISKYHREIRRQRKLN